MSAPKRGPAFCAACHVDKHAQCSPTMLGPCACTCQPIEADGSPDRPYTLRVQRADAHHEARIQGAVFGYFGYVASRDCSVTSTDSESYRVVVPNLSGGSTCYRVEWI